MLVRILLSCLFLFFLTSSFSQDVNRPNIILIMADDMGYECLGSYGSAAYHTPNLDRMAEDGVRFEHCYSQPLCTPSRVKIMTGKYNFRNYMAFGYLDPEEKTFGNLLQDAGYSTCVAGKWQLNGISGGKLPGWDDTSRPHHFGFDEYCLWQLHNTRAEGERYADPLLVRNGQALPRDANGYGSKVISDFILDFIDRKKDRPFFVYYPMNLVHDPFVPTPDSRDWADPDKRHLQDTSYFKDMVAYTDKIIGKIMDKLEETGVADNTLVIFTGDNGTHVNIYSKMKDGRVIKGDKGNMTDGGTRVPLIAYWKGHSLSGVVNSDLVDFSDFLPTLAEAAGIALTDLQQLDGRSFLPQVLGKPANPKSHIYMYYNPKWGRFSNGVFVRNQRYKLYDDGRFFDIEADVLEQHPQYLADLTGELLEVAVSFQRVMEEIH
ncbi:MAG: sulfatase-like hydrolase/transferase [Lunatimonas sp.]|uniref:sulfatase-like hydrolase/transferase n=1 Tax=Lunatimonas sp. TaxID=2060141 RepID=UPI00263A691D|nr:sulfatase-like hydrolase/transferase [Lunatimonas sp.]MCC5938237.1 sulfatase-like hydrolase/transferase [Lunatimonas sp.]